MLLASRRKSYIATFNSPAGQQVLADLRRFCRATESTADVNSINATYLLEGRREVYLRILKYLNMSQDDLYKLQKEESNYE